MTFPRTLHGQLLLLALAAGVPLALLDAYSLLRESRANREMAAESMRRLAVSVAGVLDRDLAEARTVLDSVVQRPQVRTLDAARCDPIFESFRVLHPHYANLALLDTACHVVCAAIPPRAGQPDTLVALRSWLRTQPPAIESFLTPPLSGRDAGSRSAFLGVRVGDRLAQAGGWLEISLDLERFQRQLERLALPGEAEVLVFDRRGDVVARTVSAQAWIGRNLGGQEIVARTRTTTDGWGLMRGADGVRRIYGFRRVPEAGWMVCAGLPWSAMDASLWMDLRYGGLLMLATLLLAFALLLAIRGRIERPIRMVIEAVHEVAGGRTGTRLPVTGSVEIAQLASEFNAVLEAGAQSDRELRRREHEAAVGAMVAEVAHEVRNPLFGITANLDAFEARYGARQEFRGFLEVVRSEVDRLIALMDGLLEYGRAARIESTPSSLHEIVAEAARACRPQADGAGVVVQNRVSAELPQVGVDRTKLVRVFHNLMDDAIHHAPAGSEVRVEAGVEAAGDRRWLAVKVADDGPGFRSQDLEHVFEPFFSRSADRNGLGMSIVSRIVECHGGTVVAANRPEGGAVVTVRLPIA
jgi:signal transduction histidine kinase